MASDPFTADAARLMSPMRQYRVVCADGEARVVSVYTEAVRAHDLRHLLDGTESERHAACKPHRVEERTVTYGDWR